MIKFPPRTASGAFWMGFLDALDAVDGTRGNECNPPDYYDEPLKEEYRRGWKAGLEQEGIEYVEEETT